MVAFSTNPIIRDASGDSLLLVQWCLNEGRVFCSFRPWASIFCFPVVHGSRQSLLVASNLCQARVMYLKQLAMVSTISFGLSPFVTQSQDCMCAIFRP